jgi:hypothetical protein
VELLGDLYGMPFLLATTRNASTPSREYAVAALGKTKIGEAEKDLLVADPDWRMRLLAAQTLGRTDPELARRRAAGPRVARAAPGRRIADGR